MAILNVTYEGVSADYARDIDPDLSDQDIKRIAEEVIRSGEIPALRVDIQPGAFSNFVVDRFETPEGGRRLYLRPKVPFGAA